MYLSGIRSDQQSLVSDHESLWPHLYSVYSVIQQKAKANMKVFSCFREPYIIYLYNVYLAHLLTDRMANPG